MIANNFPHITGGADRQCLELAEGLKRAGQEVRFLTTAGRSSLSGATVPANVTRSTRDHLPPTQKLRVASLALWNRPAYAAACHLIERFAPDVIHCHKLYPQLSVAPVVAASARGVAVVQTIHDYEFVSANPEDDSGRLLDVNESRVEYRALNSMLFQIKRHLHVPAVTRWIAVSRKVAETYDGFGVTSTVLPNFTQPICAPGYRARSGVLYVGRLTAEKGVPDLLEAASMNPDISVRVAGHGPLEGNVREVASTLHNLEFLGELEPKQVREELLRSRICVMPSRWQEPGPLACLEAMAAGTPLVAYDVGGLGEYVRDAAAGWVVDPSVASLGRALRRSCEEDEQWSEFSGNGVRAVATTHSLGRYIDGVVDVYEEARRAVSRHDEG